jgi:hypothetical protein
MEIPVAEGMLTTEWMPATAGMGRQQQQETQQLDTATSGERHVNGSKNTANSRVRSSSRFNRDITGSNISANASNSRDVRNSSRDTCNSSVERNFTNQ